MESTSPEFAATAAVAGGENFIVEDLLDFSDDTFDDINGSNISTSSSAADSPSSSSSAALTASVNGGVHFPVVGDGFSGVNFSADFCVPYDELAELEWLSNFVEESFSSEDLQLQLITGVSAMKTRPDEPEEIQYYHPDPPQLVDSPNPVFSPEMPVRGKARSKRSRTASGNWASRLLIVNSNSDVNPAQSDSTPNPIKPVKTISKKKSAPGLMSRSSPELASGEVRRCLHCATDKTPQWRTGPLGPKTLCNACGVRYKSGRLVPEYRPASSPTFVLTKHSNSHRKVMELRRQKELQRQQLQQPRQHLHYDPNNSGPIMFDSPNSDDYLIHQHIGPDFRQLI